jgi:hypothetical protein
VAPGHYFIDTYVWQNGASLFSSRLSSAGMFSVKEASVQGGVADLEVTFAGCPPRG